jgi:hypothetical protein
VSVPGRHQTFEATGMLLGIDTGEPMVIAVLAPHGLVIEARYRASQRQVKTQLASGVAERTVFTLTTPTPDGVDPEAA